MHPHLHLTAKPFYATVNLFLETGVLIKERVVPYRLVQEYEEEGQSKVSAETLRFIANLKIFLKRKY